MPRDQAVAERWLLAFVEALAVGRGLSPSTIRSYLAAVAYHWTVAGVDLDVWGRRVALALRGAERLWRERGTLAQPRLPFTADLVAAAYGLRHDPGWPHGCFAAVAFGYAFLLRRGEFLPGGDSSNAVRMGDVSFLWSAGRRRMRLSDAGSALGPLVALGPPQQLAVSFRRSKTDQLGRGAVRVVDRARDPRVCACSALWELAQRASPQQEPELPVFAGVPAEAVVTMMRRAAVLCGLDPSRFTLHSLRIGGLTQLLEAGVPPHLAQFAGRWRSDVAVRAYFRATQAGTRRVSEALTTPAGTAASLAVLYPSAVGSRRGRGRGLTSAGGRLPAGGRHRAGYPDGARHPAHRNGA